MACTAWGRSCLTPTSTRSITTGKGACSPASWRWERGASGISTAAGYSAKECRGRATSTSPIWLDALIGLAADGGLATEEELTSGHAEPDAEVRTPAITADKVAPALDRGSSARRGEVEFAARFSAGDKVHARNINPHGHTRLPRYVRGHNGVVDRVHGVFVLPDSNADLAGEAPQTVYSVCFTAAELWGDDAPHPADKVFVDMWDTYLEPA